MRYDASFGGKFRKKTCWVQVSRTPETPACPRALTAGVRETCTSPEGLDLKLVECGIICDQKNIFDERLRQYAVEQVLVIALEKACQLGAAHCYQQHGPSILGGNSLEVFRNQARYGKLSKPKFG